MKAVQYRRFRDEAVSHFEAMGAARRSEIERVETALRNGTSVVLTGPSGIGKSYVASQVVSRIEATMRSVGNETPIRCTRFRDVERLTRLASAAANPAGILTIEDAHLLSVADLRLLAEFVAHAEGPVLITVNVRHGEATSSESLERSRIITGLWSNLGLERVDLSGIGFTEAASIIDAASGGAGVDVVTRARIVHGASGNPQLVTELTREALQNSTGYGVDVSSLVIGPITLSPRILDLTRDRIAGLSDVDEYALVTLAKVGPVAYVRAGRLIGQAPLRFLLRRGLVTHLPGSTEYVAANLLYAGAAQASRDSDNPLEAEHTVEQILLAEVRAGDRLTSNECAIVAAYWLNTPLANNLANPLPGEPPHVAAAIFARAARRADVWGLAASSETFARRSLALYPTVAATELLSRALAGQGMHPAALDILENERLEHTDPLTDSQYVSWWFTLLKVHDHRAERMTVLREHTASWGTVDGVLDELESVQAMRDRLIASEFEDGHDELVAFAKDSANTHASRLRALVELIPAYSYRGAPDELSKVLRLGRDLVGELAMHDQAVVTAEARSATAMFLTQAGLAKTVLGQDRIGVERDLDGYALRAVLGGNEFELALVNFVSGVLSLAAGRTARAEVELARAEIGVDMKVESNALITIRLLRGNALAALGRAHEARMMLRTVESMEACLDPWADFYLEYLRTVADFDTADADEQRSSLLKLTSFKRGQSREVTMMTAFQAFRTGEDPDRLLALVDELAPSGKSEVGDLVEELLRAESARDAFRLDVVAQRFAELGLVEQSRAAFDSAAALHRAEGRSAEASASYGRRDLQAKRQTPAPKAVAPPAVNANIARLTRRELEVARLAGSGLSNSEIASRLFLSVRTVESHVLQARVKLGAGRRSELGQYVKEFERTAS